MTEPPDSPPPNESDSSSSEDAPGGEDGTTPESPPESLQDKAGDLVDKIQQNGGRSSRGRSFGTCGGCVLVFALLLGLVGFYRFPEVGDLFAYRHGPPDEIERAARRILSFDLPGGSRGISLYRAFVEVVTVESEARPPHVRLILHRFPGRWPGWIRRTYFRLADGYRRVRGGPVLEFRDPRRRSVCGRTMSVESATGREDPEGGGATRTAVGRGCVGDGENVRCATVIVRGEQPTATVRGVMDSLSCP